MGCLVRFFVRSLTLATERGSNRLFELVTHSTDTPLWRRWSARSPEEREDSVRFGGVGPIM